MEPHSNRPYDFTPVVKIVRVLVDLIVGFGILVQIPVQNLDLDREPSTVDGPKWTLSLTLIGESGPSGPRWLVLIPDTICFSRPFSQILVVKLKHKRTLHHNYHPKHKIKIIWFVSKYYGAFVRKLIFRKSYNFSIKSVTGS